MGWFDLDADTAERALRAAFATVLDTSAAEPVGGGVFLAGRSVLTCAHVVNAALGRSMFEPRHPGGVTLRLDFPDGSAEAVIRTWIPPRAPGGGPAVLGALEWQGDLAVLELTTRPPGQVRPQRWNRMARRQKVRAWYGTGHRVSYVDTSVKLCEPDASYLDTDLATGPAIGPGYSGGPLWSYEQEAVVGLVVGQLIGTRAEPGRSYADRAFALSWQTIRAELERVLGAAALGALLPPEPGTLPPGSAARDEQRRLAILVRELLSDPAERGHHARYVAAECGLPAGPAGSAPAPEVLAETLCATPRALAALVESLVRERPADAERFLALGRAAGAAKLLSPSEYDWLIDLLGSQHPPALAEAAQAVLPGLVLPRRLPGGERDFAETLVERLEVYTGGHSIAGPGRPRPPALLKVAEYGAAAFDQAAGQQRPGRHPGQCAGQSAGEELRAWSRRVAGRLGAPYAVLDEYAAEAAEWAARGQDARSAAVAPRVAVRLTRYEHGGRDAAGRFRCALWTDPGDGELRAVPLSGPHPLGPDEVARLVRATLAGWDEPEESGAEGRPGPVVEFFLDEPELGLPAEEWDSADPDDPEYDGEPEPLGLAHPVVVRLAGSLSPVRERERAKALRRRWSNRDRAEPLQLVAGGQELRQVKGAVYRDLDTARIVLGTADRAGRPAVAAICLRLGVPVVLWDRHAPGEVTAAHFGEIAPAGPADGLPERVRSYRAAAWADAAGWPARPVLALEDPSRPPPPVLELADPDDYAPDDGYDSSYDQETSTA
ncbi:trypsin-like peptidase domain-containing protein [Kitasatospora sp. MAP5-34]|uniref:VMAP-C domain-containing protein n=1 Tax=Kitasatospora sp. MAP5-34 TaxID=3035102 RepID=UPI0024743D16|nr:trypsin-like peptidase domain-containing protein [Kitasatospora sp. MAP5-34]MDH6576168.1 hypothetical protein [Kitasatospora sp. MAP5-34]